MPYKWNAESERALLLAVISESDHKPSTQVWTAVANRLGGGLNASATSYANTLFFVLGGRPPSLS